MKSLIDLLMNRRSIRTYLDKPVEKEKIRTILQGALTSPASKHSNCWEFIVVDDRDMLEKLAQCRETGSQFIAQAPLAIVVLADSSKSVVWQEDASIASIILQLGAQDLGLSSCWVQVHGRVYTDEVSSEIYIQRLLDIPEDIKVLNIITIGYKNEDRKSFEKEKLQYEKIHYNKY